MSLTVSSSFIEYFVYVQITILAIVYKEFYF